MYFKWWAELQSDSTIQAVQDKWLFTAARWSNRAFSVLLHRTIKQAILCYLSQLSITWWNEIRFNWPSSTGNQTSHGWVWTQLEEIALTAHRSGSWISQPHLSLSGFIMANKKNLPASISVVLPSHRSSYSASSRRLDGSPYSGRCAANVGILAQLPVAAPAGGSCIMD